MQSHTHRTPGQLQPCPLNEPRHKGQSLWIGSTMLRKKMPPLNPPPLNYSPLYDLEIIASQKDVRHVKFTFNNNPATVQILEKFLSHLHSPTSLTPGIQGLIQAKYHTAAQSRSIVHSFLQFCATTLYPNLWTPYLLCSYIAHKTIHQTS